MLDEIALLLQTACELSTKGWDKRKLSEKELREVNSALSHYRNLLGWFKRNEETKIRPAIRYLSNTLPKQYNHIVSENIEETEAYMCFMRSTYSKLLKHDYAMELIDGQMTRETMLHILGYSEKDIEDLRREVIKKNNERNYYAYNLDKKRPKGGREDD